MELKKCSRCGEIKELEEFHKSKSRRDGYNNICKECNRKKASDWYKENTERGRKRSRDHREANLGECKEYGKEYYQKNKERFSEYEKRKRRETPRAIEIEKERLENIGLKKCGRCKEWKELSDFGNERRTKDKLRHVCKKCNNIDGKRWADANSERIAETAKRWAKANPEKCNEKSKRYREANPEKVRNAQRKCRRASLGKYREYNNEYRRIKTENDPQFKLRCRISSAINKRLKRRLSSKKGKSTFDFLPYTLEELMAHLENLFIEGMTWQNHGFYGWHIDHKKPESLFNYKNVTDKEFQECWALENLQPLWWYDNLSKGNKY